MLNTHPVVNTLGLPPALLDTVVPVRLVPLEVLCALLDDGDVGGHFSCNMSCGQTFCRYGEIESTHKELDGWSFRRVRAKLIIPNPAPRDSRRMRRYGLESKEKPEMWRQTVWKAFDAVGVKSPILVSPIISMLCAGTDPSRWFTSFCNPELSFKASLSVGITRWLFADRTLYIVTYDIWKAFKGLINDVAFIGDNGDESARPYSISGLTDSIWERPSDSK